MININFSDLEKQSKEYINMLTDNKGQDLRKEMIKFLKESYWDDSNEYGIILEFINDFFFAFRPERLNEKTFEDLEGSDSLNTMET